MIGTRHSGDFGSEWLTHPLPQVVPTSSKRDPGFEAEARCGVKSALNCLPPEDRNLD